MSLEQETLTDYLYMMSIPDNLIYSYFNLATDKDLDFLADIKHKLDSNEYNPMDMKKELGVTLAAMYQGEENALRAKEEFERIFSDKGLPDDIPEFSAGELGGTIWVVRLLTETKMAKSGGEARRLINGGGLYLNDERITDDKLEIELKKGMLFKVGKRRFFKIIE